MKKTIISALALMLGVLGFSGCTKTDDNISVEVNGGKTITFVAEMDSRTIMTGEKPNFSTNWVKGDKVGLYSFNTENDNEDGSHSQTNYNRNRTFTVESVSNGVATMTGTTYNDASSTGKHMFYGYYPCVENAKDEYTAVNMNIPSVQNMPVSETATFDPAANIMVAKPMLVNLNETNLTFNNIRFRHTVAFINLSTKAISAEGVSGDEIVSSVKFDAAGKTLAGDFQFNLKDGTMTFTKSESAVTVNVPANTKLSDLSAWIVTNPFEMTDDDELVITITTDAHTIIKNVSIAKNFEAANVYTLNLTIDKECEIPKDAVYELVTDASTLAEGDQVIIAAVDADYALGSQRYNSSDSPTNRSGISITKDKDGNIINPSTDVVIMNLENGLSTVSGTSYAFNLGEEGYLAAVSSSSNNLATNSTKTKNCCWTININIENNNASIIAQGNYTRNYLRYNPNNGTPIFACYNSASQEPVQIYRLSDGKTKLAKPQINDNFTINAEQITASWTGDNNAQGYYWKLCKGNDILKEVEKTTDTSITIKATDIVGLTQFEEGVKYVLYVKSLGDGVNYKDSEEASKEISFGGTSGGDKATYTLTFSKTTMQKSVQNYTSSWKNIVDGYTWNIINFNNNQTNWNFIKCGSKTASIATITTDWAITEAIEKVVVTVDKLNKDDVKSTKLEVATDAAFTQIVQTIELSIASGDMTYNVPTPAENCYYRLTYDCNKSTDGKTNGQVQISKVVYTNE